MDFPSLNTVTQTLRRYFIPILPVYGIPIPPTEGVSRKVPKLRFILIILHSTQIHDPLFVAMQPAVHIKEGRQLNKNCGDPT